MTLISASEEHQIGLECPKCGAKHPVVVAMWDDGKLIATCTRCTITGTLKRPDRSAPSPRSADLPRAQDETTDPFHGDTV